MELLTGTARYRPGPRTRSGPRTWPGPGFRDSCLRRGLRDPSVGAPVAPGGDWNLESQLGVSSFGYPEVSESSRRGPALRRGLAARARLYSGRDCPNWRLRVPGTEREVDPAPKDSDQLELESDLPLPLQTRMPPRRPAVGCLHCTPGTLPTEIAVGTVWAMLQCGVRAWQAQRRQRWS